MYLENKTMLRNKLKELYMEGFIGNDDPVKYLELAFNSGLTTEETKEVAKEVEKELNDIEKELNDLEYYKLFVEKYSAI